jgi:hypothetical protein
MDMYDILKKLNSVGGTPLYESAVQRAAAVDKSRIPAYKRKDSGEEKLTLKDLEAERSKSATGAAGLKKLKDRTGIRESEVEEGYYKDPDGDDESEEDKEDKKDNEKRRREEDEMDEGNEFVKARRDAIRAGKPTFMVGGKTHKVTGDTSQEKAGVDESAEETPRGRIHRAAPGGYGRKYDQDDEEGGEKKPAAPKIDRGRGRPKKEREPFSGDEASKLQSFVVGNKPKSGLPGKAGVKHTKMADQEKAEKARERASAKGEVDEAVRGLYYGDKGIRPPQTQPERDQIAGDIKQSRATNRADQTTTGYGNRVAPQRGAASSATPGQIGAKTTNAAGQTAFSSRSADKKYANYAGNINTTAGAGKGVAEGEDEFDPANRGEYDREGEMAQDQLTTAADAASELRSILDSDENLPEWVQSKITKAVDYLDTARDYMKSKDDGDEPVKEAGNYSAKRARAGADIGKPGKKPDFLDMDKDGNKKEPMKKAVADKKAGLKKEVEETTTAGSVATAPAEGGKKTKGGVQFGKGVYEGALAESFSSKLKTMLNEEISMNLSTNSNGTKSLTVTATDDDAMRLAEILKLAGMESQAPAGDTAEACGACGQSPCGCDHIDEDDHANSPDPMYADTDTMVMKLAGGLNGPKVQVNPNNMADNPLAMKRLGVKQSPQVNLGSADIGESIEKRLWTIYNRQDT